MRALATALLLSAMAISLSGCMGNQTGNGFSKFDSKSFWETDDTSGGGGDSGASSSPDSDN